jgi:hypothetical protein
MLDLSSSNCLASSLPMSRRVYLAAMVEANICHVYALVEDEEFAFEEVDAVVRPAGEEVGGAFSAQAEGELVIALHRATIFKL